jgi:hypothetical protein
MANSGQSLQAGSPSACVSSSAAGFRSKVQAAAVVNKDSAVSDARPYQIPSHSMHHEIRTYAELQQHMRDALREQHPEVGRAGRRQSYLSFLREAIRRTACPIC